MICVFLGFFLVSRFPVGGRDTRSRLEKVGSVDLAGRFWKLERNGDQL